MLSDTSRLLRQDRRGAASAEFALVALAFFMLLLGVIEIGRYFFTQHNVRTLTAETARQAVVRTAINAGGCTLTGDDVTAIKTAAIRKTPFLSADAASTYTVTCTVSSGMYVINVAVTYTFSTPVPFVSFLAGGIADSTQMQYSAIRG